MVIHGPNSNGFPVEDALIRRIEELARRRGETPAEVLRLAVESLEQRRVSAPTEAPGSPYERAQRAGLLGSVKDAPPDLSTNPDRVNGLGCGRF